MTTPVLTTCPCCSGTGQSQGQCFDCAYPLTADNLAAHSFGEVGDGICQECAEHRALTFGQVPIDGAGEFDDSWEGWLKHLEQAGLITLEAIDFVNGQRNISVQLTELGRATKEQGLS